MCKKESLSFDFQSAHHCVFCNRDEYIYNFRFWRIVNCGNIFFYFYFFKVCTVRFSSIAAKFDVDSVNKRWSKIEVQRHTFSFHVCICAWISPDIINLLFSFKFNVFIHFSPFFSVYCLHPINNNNIKSSIVTHYLVCKSIVVLFLIKSL